MIDTAFEKNGTIYGAPTQAEKDAWKLKHGEVFCIGSSKGDVYVAKPTRAVLSMILTKAKTDVLAAADVILTNCWLHGDESLKQDNGFLLGLVNQLDAIIETVTVEVKKI
jgi:hypothetical protein